MVNLSQYINGRKDHYKLTIPVHIESSIPRNPDLRNFVAGLTGQGLDDSNFRHDFYDRLSAKERLSALLRTDLGFSAHKSGYASHDLHAFAAKFPPQLARLFIMGLTQPGEVVLDPMVGSGTTVVEAMLCGRRGLGVDIDPLAIRLSTVKTTKLDLTLLRLSIESVINDSQLLLMDPKALDSDMRENFDDAATEFLNYWFLRETQRELMALRLAIENVPNDQLRLFHELTFSSIIVTKSGGVSLARDLAHSRPHLDKNKKPKAALELYAVRARKNLASLAALGDCKYSPRIVPGDARCLMRKSNSIDLVVTSPPYANAIDYMRAHKFSLIWFGDSVQMLSQLRSRYIGSEKTNGLAPEALPADVENAVCRLEALDPKKSRVLHKYYDEMRMVIQEIYRVLRPDACAILVVGSSTMRGLDVETHISLAHIAEQIGFQVVGISRREIDRNRRMMPATFGRKSESGIEQRMHDEYVLGFHKAN